MNRATWKATERAIAAELGGTRVPVTGRIRGDAPDVAHPTLAIEVKKRRNALPGYVKDGIEQAEASALEQCKRDGSARIPIVVIEEANGRGHSNQRYVVMRFEEFRELIEGES